MAEQDVNNVGDAFGKLHEQAEAAFSTIGDESMAQIQEMCSVPVGHSGGLIIRSAPSEPPRKETGNLYAGFGKMVGGDNEGVHLLVYNVVGYDYYLQVGTGHIKPRNHWDRLLSYWEFSFVSRLGELMAA